MKKVLFTAMILGSVLMMSSCDNDDSDNNNDIDVITPNNDTTKTSILNVPQRRKA